MAVSRVCPRSFVPTVWRVVALDTPRVRRRCPGCDAQRSFRSSDKFRVNAHQRRLDVWLIYRCERCDATWNRAVRERVSPRALDPDAHRAYMANDRDAAWACAFDLVGLRQLGAVVDAAVPVRVHRDVLPDKPFRVRFELDHPCELRLDRLVAQELEVSRGALSRLIARGDVRVEAPSQRAWRRPVRKEVTVIVTPSG
ncbi:MAG: DUF1062 domain-containing protein [Myxococcales bacterium]|nr:DUF1062 domain-containing protein [Myxococcales bacterium]